MSRRPYSVTKGLTIFNMIIGTILLLALLTIGIITTIEFTKPEWVESFVGTRFQEIIEGQTTTLYGQEIPKDILTYFIDLTTGSYNKFLIYLMTFSFTVSFYLFIVNLLLGRLLLVRIKKVRHMNYKLSRPALFFFGLFNLIPLLLVGFLLIIIAIFKDSDYTAEERITNRRLFGRMSNIDHYTDTKAV